MTLGVVDIKISSVNPDKGVNRFSAKGTQFYFAKRVLAFGADDEMTTGHDCNFSGSVHANQTQI